jgi:glucuronate isomerase
MRMSGIDESLITGNAAEKDKFLAFASCMPGLIGNPLYHWSNMELWRYCGVDEALSPDIAESIWAISGKKLKELPPKEIMRISKVEAVCTTDDPADDLQYHKEIATDKSFETCVVPAFRPDKALNIENPGWREYIQILASAANVSITGMDSLKQALSARMDAFAALGCRAADHGLTDVPFLPCPETAETAFSKAINGLQVSFEEREAFKAELLLFCGQEYAKRNWVMEIHFGVLRNVSSKNFAALGPDTGFDIMGQPRAISGLAEFFNVLQEWGRLPKIVLFSINPADNAALCSLSGAFGSNVQQGSAWWFNDTKNGMLTQLRTFAELLPLGSFIGFITDSRSFLSYTRHEYFRRILCGMLGQLVESGEYPDDRKYLIKLVGDICYYNVKKFFDF